ncbi:MAG: hypothetical protein HC830_15560 [Bacteroidetes bacterium]|nr:hypothetical protein [Bacteroidota bacterium]
MESDNKQIIACLLERGAEPFHREELYNMYMDSQRNLTEQELLEMASLSSKGTGLKQVILWVGPNPYGDEIRVKVNNVPNNLKNFDLFDIILPDYKISGEVNTNFITGDLLQQIIQFIDLNKEIITSFSKYEIDTIELVRNLKKVSK